MTAPSASARAGRLRPRAVEGLAQALESSPAFGGRLANQHLLDALDHGEYGRFLIWPDHDPVSVVYLAPHGTVVPSGDADGADALAVPVERSGWRVMIGDASLCAGLLDGNGRAMFRRRSAARNQLFMSCVEAVGFPSAVPGLRPARSEDIEAMTDFAARLHVEDRMGPPLGRTGVAALRSRMTDSVARGASWVVERAGAPVAKIDISLHSARRGAQIAGVYVAKSWRGQGLATRSVAAVTAHLLASDLPGVTLHVRQDNAAAIRAYERAGFSTQGMWLLALR